MLAGGLIDMVTAKRKTGILFFPAFDWAISPDHPEREERLLYTRDQIVEEGLFDIDDILEYRPRLASRLDILRTHVCVPGVDELVTPSHLIAAGGTMVIADAVMQGEVDAGFALVRPPGHHAMRVVHGNRGFCTINNEAVMIEYIRHRYGKDLKFAVVDTDAHHADGTQDIYYNDPQVLHISIHQDGRTLYPGTGFVNELGGPGAYAYTLNIPLPPGTGDEGLLYVLHELVLPVLDDFRPDVLINAAGQDNHYSDPLTSMQVSAQGYARLTQELNPDIVVLEGGYSIEGALPYVNVGIILALAGLDYSCAEEPDYRRHYKGHDRQVAPQVKETVGLVKQVWKNRHQTDLDKVFGNERYYTRQRRIFYDTDYIMEQQHEQICKCPNCSGYRLVTSTTDRYGPGRQAFIVLIPPHACSECQEKALVRWEKEKNSKQYHLVYLQDLANDTYLSS